MSNLKKNGGFPDDYKRLWGKWTAIFLFDYS